MPRDKLIITALAGLIGTLPVIMIEYCSYFIGWTHITTGIYLAQVIFRTKSLGWAELSIGTLAHFLAGAVIGVVLLAILILFGRDAYQLKGVGVGCAFWLSHVVLLPAFFAPRWQLCWTSCDAFLALVALISWGLTTVYIIVKFMPETAFRS